MWQQANGKQEIASFHQAWTHGDVDFAIVKRFLDEIHPLISKLQESQALLLQKVSAFENQIAPPPPPLQRHQQLGQQGAVVLCQLPPATPCKGKCTLNPGAEGPPATVHEPVIPALCPVPRIPAFPMTMPESMEVLLQQHRASKLDLYEKASKTHWPQHVRTAFSRRTYLFQVILQSAQGLRVPVNWDQRNEKAAKLLDVQRQDLTLSQFLIKLKQTDPKTRKRKRKRLS